MVNHLALISEILSDLIEEFHKSLASFVGRLVGQGSLFWFGHGSGSTYWVIPFAKAWITSLDTCATRSSISECSKLMEGLGIHEARGDIQRSLGWVVTLEANRFVSPVVVTIAIVCDLSPFETTSTGPRPFPKELLTRTIKLCT